MKLSQSIQHFLLYGNPSGYQNQVRHCSLRSFQSLEQYIYHSQWHILESFPTIYHSKPHPDTKDPLQHVLTFPSQSYYT